LLLHFARRLIDAYQLGFDRLVNTERDIEYLARCATARTMVSLVFCGTLPQNLEEEDTLLGKLFNNFFCTRAAEYLVRFPGAKAVLQLQQELGNFQRYQADDFFNSGLLRTTDGCLWAQKDFPAAPLTPHLAYVITTAGEHPAPKYLIIQVPQ